MCDLRVKDGTSFQAFTAFLRPNRKTYMLAFWFTRDSRSVCPRCGLHHSALWLLGQEVNICSLSWFRCCCKAHAFTRCFGAFVAAQVQDVNLHVFAAQSLYIVTFNMPHLVLGGGTRSQYS